MKNTFDLNFASKELDQINNQIDWVNSQIKVRNIKKVPELLKRLDVERRRLEKWGEKYDYK